MEMATTVARTPLRTGASKSTSANQSSVGMMAWFGGFGFHITSSGKGGFSFYVTSGQGD